MGKVFRPSTRESSILSKIESTKEHKRRLAISSIRDASVAHAAPTTPKAGTLQ